jgi:Ni/Fe-hydrogenase subunit HybB-like protein
LDLLPDLAAMRDKAKRPAVKFIYGFLALGWRGDARHWEGLHKAAYLLAALATPLVISVHSIVGLDFAIGTLPGWHHTIIPPFFVGGAIFSGLAMMIIFGVILRAGFKMHDLINDDHMDKAAKLMLLTGLIVTYGYLVEWFGAFYKGDPNEVALTLARAFGPYGLVYWAMIFFNSVVIQLLWFKQVRRNMNYLVLISVGVLIGMWIERFIIVPVSLSYGYTTTSWALFNPGIWDVLTVVGSFGLFFSAMFVFIRFFPVVPIHETQQALAEEAANG